MKKETLIQSIVYIVIGVLLCLSVINFNEMMGWMIGLSLLIAGVLLILISAVSMKSLLTINGLAGSLLVAFGLLFIPNCVPGVGLAYDLIIALIMMTLGALFLVEAFIGIFNKRPTVGTVVLFLFGAAFFTVGMLLWFLPEFRRFAGLMLGIFLIVYGVLIIISAATKKDFIIVEVKKNKK
jgi:hypothetical protein